MMHPISYTTVHQASFEDVAIELAELGQAALQGYAAAHDSLRSPPIASHLHLIHEVPELPNAEFMTQLINQLNSTPPPNNVGIKGALLRLINRHRNSINVVGAGVTTLLLVAGVGATIQFLRVAAQMRNASYEEYQVLQDNLRQAGIVLGALLGTSVLSLAGLVLFQYATRNMADPFLNGPNVIDQNIEDPHALNNEGQNVHAASLNRGYVATFQALQATITNPADKALTKQHILQVFDYLCEGESSDFKREMIALNRTNSLGTDAEKLQAVKTRVENAIGFMLSDAQADRTPMHYPSTVTTSASLIYVWGCIEQLSVAGYEDQARLLTENLLKALHASHGLCNTGHVSRVLQAFGDTARFSFNQDASIEETSQVITPQNFYDLSQNELNTLLSNVVNTQSIRAQLHDLRETYAEDNMAYKEAATLVVQEVFSSRLELYLAENYAPMLSRNPQFHEQLMHFFETDFAAFIDNARDNDDTNSITSFS